VRTAFAALALSAATVTAGCDAPALRPPVEGDSTVQLGPRPFYLVNDMAGGALKDELTRCFRGPFRPSRFSIAHRGAPLQFAEHTRASYEAAARMGAGIIECDVTFTKDKALVCRHSQADLDTTTNILVTPLAARCSRPFTPAVLGANGAIVRPASAECRTSDVTLAELKTLVAKMDGFNPAARTPAEYLDGTPSFRTDLYATPTGAVLSHRESIELFKTLGVMMTPELKAPIVAMPFDGLTADAYAQQMIDEYKAAGVPPDRVWPQSFEERDVRYWIEREPAFGRQAIYLEDARTPKELPSLEELRRYKAAGINIVGPPLFALLELDPAGRIVPSRYARDAKAAGLQMIAWTVERSGMLVDRGTNGDFYQTIDAGVTRDGDLMTVLDVLARQVGVTGVFSDWPASVTFYANCRGLE
jgi:glycerophosphoryl diester phosphodiesterase